MPSQQQTLEQKRAAQAWNDVTQALIQAKTAAETELARARSQNDRRRVEEVQKALNRLNEAQGAEDFRGRYGSLARRMPAMIISDGLGQALAFLRAKGKNDGWDEHTLLDRQLSTWVLEYLQIEAADLLEVVRQHNSEVYRRARAEALALLGWLKRFAEAELPIVEDADA